MSTYLHVEPVPKLEVYVTTYALLPKNYFQYNQTSIPESIQGQLQGHDPGEADPRSIQNFNNNFGYGSRGSQDSYYDQNYYPQRSDDPGQAGLPFHNQFGSENWQENGRGGQRGGWSHGNRKVWTNSERVGRGNTWRKDHHSNNPHSQVDTAENSSVYNENNYPMDKLMKGRVALYFPDRGFGFIEIFDECVSKKQQVFVHVADIAGHCENSRWRSLAEGEIVEFKLEEQFTKDGMKLKAVNVRGENGKRLRGSPYVGDTRDVDMSYARNGPYPKISQEFGDDSKHKQYHEHASQPMRVTLPLCHDKHDVNTRDLKVTDSVTEDQNNSSKSIEPKKSTNGKKEGGKAHQPKSEELPHPSKSKSETMQESVDRNTIEQMEEVEQVPPSEESIEPKKSTNEKKKGGKAHQPKSEELPHPSKSKSETMQESVDPNTIGQMEEVEQVSPSEEGATLSPSSQDNEKANEWPSLSEAQSKLKGSDVKWKNNLKKGEKSPPTNSETPPKQKTKKQRNKKKNKKSQPYPLPKSSEELPDDPRKESDNVHEPLSPNLAQTKLAEATTNNGIEKVERARKSKPKEVIVLGQKMKGPLTIFTSNLGGRPFHSICELRPIEDLYKKSAEEKQLEQITVGGDATELSLSSDKTIETVDVGPLLLKEVEGGRPTEELLSVKTGPENIVKVHKDSIGPVYSDLDVEPHKDGGI